jgi:hypothetical protein
MKVEATFVRHESETKSETANLSKSFSSPPRVGLVLSSGGAKDWLTSV